MQDSIDWVIDRSKKQEPLFLISKNKAGRYYLYDSWGMIVDIEQRQFNTSYRHKGKRYWWGYFYKGFGLSGVLNIHDLPIVKQVDKKINKDTGEVLEYNWETGS